MITIWYLVFAGAITFLSGVALGRWWGSRTMKRFFAGVLVDRTAELASLKLPKVAWQVRNLNLTFLGWTKATERLEVARYSGAKSTALDERQVTLLTAMLGAAAKKLSAAVDEASKEATWPALDGDEIHDGRLAG